MALTPNLLLPEPAPLSQATDNTWGATLNTGIYTLTDDALAGIENISTTGGATILTSNAGAPDQSRQRLINVTGSLTSNALILMPPGVNRFFSVNNLTTGSGIVIVGVSNGSGGVLGSSVVVSQNSPVGLISDGTNVFSENGAGAQLLNSQIFLQNLFVDCSSSSQVVVFSPLYSPVSGSSLITVECVSQYIAVIANGPSSGITATLEMEITAPVGVGAGILAPPVTGGAGSVASTSANLALSPQGALSMNGSFILTKKVLSFQIDVFAQNLRSPAITCAVTSCQVLVQEWQ